LARLGLENTDLDIAYLLRGTANGGNNATVRAATTEVFFEPGDDCVAIRRCIGFEQGCRCNDEACCAISALRGAFGDKSPLDGSADGIIFKGFDGHDFLACELTCRAVAAQCCFAIDQHSAGAALFQPATELGACQIEIVAQYIEEWRRGIAIDVPCFTVNRERQ